MHANRLAIAFVFCSAAVLLTCTAPAVGQTVYNWTHNNNNNWDNAGNWSGASGFPDDPNHTVNFDSANFNSIQNEVDTEGQTFDVHDIVLTDSDETFTFRSSVAAPGLIRLHGDLLFDNDLASQIGDHDFDVNLEVVNSSLWRRGTDHGLDFDAVLSGSGTITARAKTAAAGFTHSIWRNANTFDGSLIIDNVHLGIRHPNAFQNADVEVNYDDGFELFQNFANPVQIRALAGTGDLLLAGNEFVTTSSSKTTFSGDLNGQGSPSFEKAGSGKLTLTGAITNVATLNNTGGGEIEITTGGSWGGIESVGGLVDIRDSANIKLTTDVTNALFARNGANVFIREGADVSFTGGGTPRVVLISNSLLNTSGAGSTLAAPRISVGPSGSGSNLFILQDSAEVSTPQLQVGDLGADDGASGSAAVNSAAILTADLIQLYLRGSLSVSEGQVVADQIANVSSTEAIKISDGTPGAALVLGGDGGSSTIGNVIQDNITGAGSILKAGTGTLVLTGDNAFTGGVTVEFGTLSLENATGSATGFNGGVQVDAAATLTGDGFGQNAFAVAGTVAPGTAADATDATGTLSLEQVDFQAGSSLAMDLGGTAAGAFDQLTLVFDAVLSDATLDLALVDGYTPTLGDSIDILTASTVVGQFASVTGTDLSDDLMFDVLYSPTSVTLQVVSTALAGDYNDDGTVNLADYTLWRDNLSAAAGTLVNDTDGGAIGTAQYETWKTHFGDMTPASASEQRATVPEPSTCTLLMLLSAVGTLGRRKAKS